MKVVLAGGSGQVGRVLARAFHGEGHQVVVLSRKPKPAPWPVVAWDGRSLGNWAEEMEGADVLINLAGRSVNCRYHARNRREIMESRVCSTRVIGEAIAKAERPPRVWLQASTATIYEHRFDAPNDEATGILGGSEPGAPDTWRFSPNAEFMRSLRAAWGARAGLPAARWMLEIGAFLLRTETELILKSRYVAPSRLVESGFDFRFPRWREAASELCARWRVARGREG